MIVKMTIGILVMGSDFLKALLTFIVICAMIYFIPVDTGAQCYKDYTYTFGK